jgi:hypothetical protein
MTKSATVDELHLLRLDEELEADHQHELAVLRARVTDRDVLERDIEAHLVDA